MTRTRLDAAFPSDGGGGPLLVLRLYVTGRSPMSVQAIANLEAVCRGLPPDRLELEIVDILEDPLRMLSDRIVATPALVRLAPLPAVRAIGDLSDQVKLCDILGIKSTRP